ncbi:hypothetical protein [Aeromonas veronii]|uniref:hypothetical protein n=1 Tax=Aeromonas veronii TaxID=654 RepID=UPI003D238AB3
MNSSKKERDESFTFLTGKDTSHITLTYDHDRDRFYIPQMNPQTLKAERGYSRDSNKKKILNSIQGVSNYAYFNVNSALINEYEFLISIDTNGKTIKGNKICVCTCYYVPGYLRNHKDGVPFNHLCSYLIKNPENNLNPERLGWYIVLSRNIKYHEFKVNDKMAVIVDSEKDLLPKINSRQVPIFKEISLHNNVFLSYSSDKDTDTLPGQMIKMCHVTAGSILREIEKDTSILNRNFTPLECCEGFIEIKLKNA